MSPVLPIAHLGIQSPVRTKLSWKNRIRSTNWRAKSARCCSVPKLTFLLSLFQPINIKLVHLQHRLHHSFCFFRVFVLQELAQDCWHNLPGHAEFGRQPPPPVFSSTGPIASPIDRQPLAAFHSSRRRISPEEIQLAA